jgi:hypothetical protein
VLFRVVAMLHPPVEDAVPVTSPVNFIVLADAKASAAPALVALPIKVPEKDGETNNPALGL